MNYESHLQGDKPVIVDFFTEWCEPCKLMIPVIREIKGIVGERATILSIDVEKEDWLAELYHIQTLPTLMIFHRGQVLWRKNGISSGHEILEHLQMVMN